MPATVTTNGTGVWWLDGAEFVLRESTYIDVDHTGATLMAGPYPRYVAALHSGEAHLVMVHCRIWCVRTVVFVRSFLSVKPLARLTGTAAARNTRSSMEVVP